MRRAIAVALLAVAVFASAIELVRVRHEARVTYVELQRLRRANDRVLEDWGRLQLEQATWGSYGRVERLASRRLHMHPPSGRELVVVAP